MIEAIAFVVAMLAMLFNFTLVLRVFGEQSWACTLLPTAGGYVSVLAPKMTSETEAANVIVIVVNILITCCLYVVARKKKLPPYKPLWVALREDKDRRRSSED